MTTAPMTNASERTEWTQDGGTRHGRRHHPEFSAGVQDEETRPLGTTREVAQGDGEEPQSTGHLWLVVPEGMDRVVWNPRGTAGRTPGRSHTCRDQEGHLEDGLGTDPILWPQLWTQGIPSWQPGWGQRGSAGGGHSRHATSLLILTERAGAQPLTHHCCPRTPPTPSTPTTRAAPTPGPCLVGSTHSKATCCPSLLTALRTWCVAFQVGATPPAGLAALAAASAAAGRGGLPARRPHFPGAKGRLGTPKRQPPVPVLCHNLTPETTAPTPWTREDRRNKPVRPSARLKKSMISTAEAEPFQEGLVQGPCRLKHPEPILTPLHPHRPHTKADSEPSLSLDLFHSATMRNVIFIPVFQMGKLKFRSSLQESEPKVNVCFPSMSPEGRAVLEKGLNGSR